MNEQKINDTMSEYRAKRVGHHLAKDVREDLRTRILTANKEKVIALVGPSGVGKTAAMERVQEMLIQHFSKEMELDPSFLPYLSVTAQTAHGADFNWTDQYARLLNAGNEPLIRRKKSFEPTLTLDGQRLNTHRGLRTAELGRAVESLIAHRRVPVIFFDEASAMTDGSVNRDVVKQFNILKSKAVTSGAVFVLVGAYDLLGVKAGTGQLLRRCKVIHMPRYKWGTTSACSDRGEETDEALFESAVLTLASATPAEVQVDPDVLSDMYFIYAKTIGCVGIFRDWWDEACVEALSNNGGRLTRKILESEALDNCTLLTLLQEADAGEEQLLDSSDDELAKRLGVESLKTQDLPPSPVIVTAPKKQRLKPGERGPTRDPVGNAYA